MHRGVSRQRINRLFLSGYKHLFILSPQLKLNHPSVDHLKQVLFAPKTDLVKKYSSAINGALVPSAHAILTSLYCQEEYTRKKNLFLKCGFILVRLPHSKSFSSSVGRVNKAASQNKAVSLKMYRKHRNILFRKSQTKQNHMTGKMIYHSFTTFCFHKIFCILHLNKQRPPKSL